MRRIALCANDTSQNVNSSTFKGEVITEMIFCLTASCVKSKTNIKEEFPDILSHNALDVDKTLILLGVTPGPKPAFRLMVRSKTSCTRL